jgi:hypothetical protein
MTNANTQPRSTANTNTVTWRIGLERYRPKKEGRHLTSTSCDRRRTRIPTAITVLIIHPPAADAADISQPSLYY